MIDPGDGRNINQNTSRLFARRSYVNIFTADCVIEIHWNYCQGRTGGGKKYFLTYVEGIKRCERKVCVDIARLKIAQNDILACKQHRKLREAAVQPAFFIINDHALLGYRASPSGPPA